MAQNLVIRGKFALEYQLRPWPSQQTSRMLKGAGIHVANVETTFHVDLTACIKNQGCAFSNGKSFISIVGGVSSFQFMRLASALCGMKPLTVTFTDTKFAY